MSRSQIRLWHRVHTLDRPQKETLEYYKHNEKPSETAESENFIQAKPGLANTPTLCLSSAFPYKMIPDQLAW